MANEEVKLSEWLASKAGLTGQKYDVALKQFKDNFTGILSSTFDCYLCRSDLRRNLCLSLILLLCDRNAARSPDSRWGPRRIQGHYSSVAAPDIDQKSAWQQSHKDLRRNADSRRQQRAHDNWWTTRPTTNSARCLATTSRRVLPLFCIVSDICINHTHTNR